MCGRYTITRPADILDEVREQLEGAGFALALAEDSLRRLEPRYNVAPTQTVPFVRRQNGGVAIGAANWGFESRGGERKQLINARVETVAEKPSFANAFAARRCLLPADGFYEWDKTSRQPHYVSLPHHQPFCFAGLWQEREPATSATEEASRRRSYAVCIVTAAAVPQLAVIHSRMPLILAPADWSCWLGDERLGEERLHELVGASPASSFELRPVGFAVNRVTTDDPSLLAEVAPAPRNLTLF